MNGMGKVAVVPAVPPVTEDTPPDLLAGCMDLRVVLPCGSVTRCNVDRGTPMMDLLVQLARAHRISPAANTLQPFGINNTPLNFQPSTPIGALDVFTVKIVPKTKAAGPPSKRAAPRPTPAQPFEQTFRLQVHLPRNQLFVTRASRATVLGDIRQLACTEKNLDPNKYELRHPANLDQRLGPESTLGECGLTEVALVAAGGKLGSSGQPDIMALRRQEDKRREAAKAGQFGYLSSHTMAADGSVSSASSGSLGGRSTSPAPSDGERSTSPLQPMQPLQPPSRPGRKRRPAPKPPVAPATTTSTTMEMNNNINKEVISSGGTVISHSRNSSDSSGYHEASVLSESPEGGVGHPDSLPGITRRSKLQSCVSQPNLNLSRSMTNLNNMQQQQQQQQQMAVRSNRNSIAVSGQELSRGLGRVPAHSASTSSLASTGQRKKKAPPPPPPGQTRPTSNGTDQFLKTQSLERQNSIPESPDPQRLKSCTLPACSTPPAAYPPVESSSSCPTPTHSDQSPHLSEIAPPKVAPRPSPRIAVQVLPCNVSPTNSPSAQAPAPAPAPRPRPRKQIAPTPPASPSPQQDNTQHMSIDISCSKTESTSVDDMDTLSEASSWVFDSQTEVKEKYSLSCNSSSQEELESGVAEPKTSADYVELHNEAPTSGVRDAIPDNVKQSFSINGEDGDSDFGTEDLSPHDNERLSEQALEAENNPIEREVKTIQKLASHSPSTEMKENRKSIEIKNPPHNNIQENLPQEISSQSSPLVEEDWEYRLPSPPSAFRDSFSHSPTVTEFDMSTRTEANTSTINSAISYEKSEYQSTTEISYPLQTPDMLMKSSSVPQLPSEIGNEISKGFDDARSMSSDTKVELEVRQDKKEEENLQLPPSFSSKPAMNETVIKAEKSVMNSNNVPMESEQKKLVGSAAVLQELNEILTEQRSKSITSRQSVPQLPLQEPAPIENFSMAAYSRPSSAEGMPLPEVRPSLVLARRSSFSNSNGCLNTLPRSQSSGVRRTTSHATLVGNRRDTSSSNDAAQSVESRGRNEETKKYAGADLGRDVKPLGRAVSEMNLNAGLSMTTFEPELLQEFMEWRQQRQKEQQEKESQKKMDGASELQSPQVLRTILPHLSQSQEDISEKSECDGSLSQKSEPAMPVSEIVKESDKKLTQENVKLSVADLKVQEPVKRFVPPSIQLSTWNERPKRQVSIKMDRDYWVGVGGAGLRPSQPSRDKVDSQEVVMATVTEKQDSQTSATPSPVDSSKNGTIKETVHRLSKQYIVHTTPSGFRRPADTLPIENGSVSQPHGRAQKNTSLEEPKTVETPKHIGVNAKLPVAAMSVVSEKPIPSLPQQSSTSVEVPVTPKTDPSRVPIVRAVELKKSITTSDFRKPLLRQNATTSSSVVYFSSGPVTTSSVSANAKLVNHTNSSKPASSFKKFTSVVDISGPSNEKPVNGTSCEKLSSNVGPSVSVNGFASHVEPKRNLPMPVVKGFKVAQGVVHRQLSSPAATPPPPDAPAPPPAPVMPVLKRVPRPISLPARVQDPRDQLLDAIRNFGGRTNLRPTS